jgi:hypothetical protein
MSGCAARGAGDADSDSGGPGGIPGQVPDWLLRDIRLPHGFPVWLKGDAFQIAMAFLWRRIMRRWTPRGRGQHPLFPKMDPEVKKKLSHGADMVLKYYREHDPKLYNATVKYINANPTTYQQTTTYLFEKLFKENPHWFLHDVEP